MSDGTLCALLVERLLQKLREDEASHRLDIFFSFEERGEKRASDGVNAIMDKESRVLTELKSRMHHLAAEVDVMNSEADSEAGWSSPRTWHADTNYAAHIARSVALHVERYFHVKDVLNQTSGSGSRLRFSGLNYDNAYLSHFPYQFTQRTLLARFQVNNTLPPFVQFVKKPIFMTYGLMGLMGEQLLHHSLTFSNNPSVQVIASCSHDNHLNQKAYTVLVVNSQDMPTEQANASVRVNLTLTFTLSDLNFEWKISRYTVDNQRTNPYKVWKDQGSRPFFTHRLLASMRSKSEPAIDISAEDVDISLSPDGFDHQKHLSFELPLPAVSLIVICSKSETGPEKVLNLRAVPVNEYEVLLHWLPSQSRCIQTYEVQYADTSSSSPRFERVNSDTLLFASFNYLSKLPF